MAILQVNTGTGAVSLLLILQVSTGIDTNKGRRSKECHMRDLHYTLEKA